MKKLIISAMLSLMAVSTFAQAGHLKFLDFEMGGPLKTFYGDVLSKGFKSLNQPGVLYRNSSAAKVGGKFAGQEDAEIMIYATSNHVDMIIVTFPVKEWGDAKSDYLMLRNSFAKKYEAQEQKEDGDIEIDGEKCTTKFSVIDGIILLTIDKKNQGYKVEITYADRPGNGHSTDRASSVMEDI